MGGQDFGSRREPASSRLTLPSRRAAHTTTATIQINASQPPIVLTVCAIQVATPR